MGFLNLSSKGYPSSIDAITGASFDPSSPTGGKTTVIDAVSGASFDPSSPTGGNSALDTELAKTGKKSVISPTVYSDWPVANYVAPRTPQVINYLDAPLAEHYSMDASTAYQEALSNTAYQRKVKDLKSAGLNPVLGISGSGAANFYGTPLPDSGSSGSYGYSSGSSNSAKSVDVSETAKKLGYWLPTIANGVTNMVVSLKTGNSNSGYGAGMIAQNLVSGALSAVRNHS